MIEKILETLFFTDNDPRALRRWRMMVALVMLSLMFGFAWSVGTFNKFGASGLAYAGDVESKITSAISPIHAEQVQQRALLTFVSDQLKESLAETKASEIRALAVKRCKEKSDIEKEILNKEIDRKQAEFFRLLNRYYPIPDCSAL